MNPLQANELAQFARKYRFAGGRIRSLKLQIAQKALTLHTKLVVQKAMKDLSGDSPRAMLKLQLESVEEYRFQKRLNMVAGRMTDFRIGYFNGTFFLNFDAWEIPPGETPAIHDFRASDAYVVGSRLFWEEVSKPQS